MGDRKPYQPPTMRTLDPHEVIRRLVTATAPPPTPEERARTLFRKMLDQFGEHQLEKLAQSWCRQTRDERRARMRVITELVLALANIRKVSIHGTRLGDAAIGAIIEGDWRDVEGYANDLSWDDDAATREQYGALWTPFVAILRTELRRRATN